MLLIKLPTLRKSPATFLNTAVFNAYRQRLACVIAFLRTGEIKGSLQ
jgi:hypothetical protein